MSYIWNNTLEILYKFFTGLIHKGHYWVRISHGVRVGDIAYSFRVLVSPLMRLQFSDVGMYNCSNAIGPCWAPLTVASSVSRHPFRTDEKYVKENIIFLPIEINLKEGLYYRLGRRVLPMEIRGDEPIYIEDTLVINVMI